MFFCAVFPRKHSPLSPKATNTCEQRKVSVGDQHQQQQRRDILNTTMSSRPNGTESAAKRPPRPEGGGRGDGRGRGRGGSSASNNAADGSSLPFALPKDLLGNCVGRSVLVTLQNGHEVTGLLEQFDEDCNLMLADVKHYLVEVVERDSLANLQQEENNNNANAGGIVGGFSFKSGAGPAGAGGIVSGSIVRTIERTRVLRECQRIILAGVNVVGIAPNTQV